METIIFRTAAMLGFRRLQSYMLPCLYALLVSSNYNNNYNLLYFVFFVMFFSFGHTIELALICYFVFPLLMQKHIIKE